jgi:phosphoribosylglycinamide formyltransferase 1
MLNIVVLISGHGSNLQAIMDAITDGLNVKISAVISNRPNAYGLERAKESNLPTHALDHKAFDSRDQFDHALQIQIDLYEPDFIILAGFMRRLGAEFVKHYPKKIINIHPSLLPKYPGLDTHQKVLDHRDNEHGVSIHYVTEALDAGPLIAQKKFTVTAKDTVDSLKEKAQAIEHQLYPDVLRQLAVGCEHTE